MKRVRCDDDEPLNLTCDVAKCIWTHCTQADGTRLTSLRTAGVRYVFPDIYVYHDPIVVCMSVNTRRPHVPSLLALAFEALVKSQTGDSAPWMRKLYPVKQRRVEEIEIE